MGPSQTFPILVTVLPRHGNETTSGYAENSNKHNGKPMRDEGQNIMTEPKCKQCTDPIRGDIINTMSGNNYHPDCWEEAVHELMDS